MAEELHSHKIKLEQVEVALSSDPTNEDLLKLKSDLEEIIKVTEELYQISGNAEPSNSRSSKTEALSNQKWKVGDRCMARSRNGQKSVAIIDGITQDKAAVTFTNNGSKDVIKLSELGVAPIVQEKNYVFQNSKQGGIIKKDWRLEKERRKVRAQKKEQRKKAIEEEQEKEKKTWKNFNQKALNKGFKGIKKIPASSSAADGPRSGIGSSNKLISSRTSSGLQHTNRGNMDSLF
jgi:survival-of-motor-neuron-related-splicing factor 30